MKQNYSLFINIRDYPCDHRNIWLICIFQVYLSCVWGEGEQRRGWDVEWYQNMQNDYALIYVNGSYGPV
jgi:hypothetical protein